MMILYRISNIIAAPILLAATILASVSTFIGCALGGERWWGYYPAKIWAKLFCWLTLVRVTVTGRQNLRRDTSYVFVCNHQGAYDIFAVYGFLGHKFKWMMKRSLERIPLVGQACRKSGHIFVDNSSPSAVHRTMEDARKRLSGGMSIVVFPEGSRTRDGRMGKFKRGAFILAEGLELPVVPVTINGSFDVMPRRKKLPRWGRITLTIHPAIIPGARGHDTAELSLRALEAVGSALAPESR